MKTIIAGSRTITDMAIVEKAIADSGFEITELVSGCAAGVDRLGCMWAAKRGIKIHRYYPNWQLFRKRAGVVRNKEMAMASEALIAVWDGKSRGTENMIAEAKTRGLKVSVYKLPVTTQPLPAKL